MNELATGFAIFRSLTLARAGSLKCYLLPLQELDPLPTMRDIVDLHDEVVGEKQGTRSEGYSAKAERSCK